MPPWPQSPGKQPDAESACYHSRAQEGEREVMAEGTGRKGEQALGNAREEGRAGTGRCTVAGQGPGSPHRLLSHTDVSEKALEKH